MTNDRLVRHHLLGRSPSLDRVLVLEGEMSRSRKQALRELIPEHLVSALDLYQDGGYWPGDCLAALLANDWSQGIEYADEPTRAALRYVLEYIDSCMPATSWGSWEAVASWGTEAARREMMG